MTKILGTPANYGSVPLKLVIREEVPYRASGRGISLGHYEAVSSGDRWVIQGGAELNMLMPRYDHFDPVALGATHFFISRADTGAVIGKYSFNPGELVETAPGEFDLARAGWARAWVRAPEFEEIRDSTKEAIATTLKVKAEAGTAAADAQAAAAEARAQRQELAQVLADTAQQREEIEAKTADLLAAAPLLPDARAAAAARPAAEAAAAQLPKAQEAASTVADAQRLAAQLAVIPTAVKGLRVQPPVAGETGGQLFEFTPDASAITPATIQPGEAGGMLYDLTGATA